MFELLGVSRPGLALTDLARDRSEGSPSRTIEFDTRTYPDGSKLLQTFPSQVEHRVRIETRAARG